MDNKFAQKSYTKAKTVRKLMRNQIFDRNRQLQTQPISHYLSIYPQSIQSMIRHSLQCEIPTNVPINTLIASLGAVTRQNIALFRRLGKPVYKTKIDQQTSLDPHMTYQSLWGLAGIQDIQIYDSYQKIIKQFQDNLFQYLSMPYPQIKQMAIIAAGNKIIGKQDEIIAIVNQDSSQLWILINHIYQRKIPFTAMYAYLNRNIPIVYKTIYEMTNNQKDEIIQSIMNNQNALDCILEALNKDSSNNGNISSGIGVNQSLEIKLYCVRIIGNILAERDDYYEIFMKCHILDKISFLTKQCGQSRNNSNSTQQSTQRKLRQDLKKDIIWMLSNYICDSAPANELLCKPNLLQKILIYFKNQTNSNIKSQIYHVIAYLAFYGDRYKIYEMALQQKILQQCCIDIQVQNQQLTLIILNLIFKLVEISEQFAYQNQVQNQGYNSQQRNPFIYYIIVSRLKTYIHAKTYNQNIQISNISFAIMDKVEEYESKFGDMDQDM